MQPWEKRSINPSPGWGERNKFTLIFCRPSQGLNVCWPANPRLHRGLLSAAPPALKAKQPNRRTMERHQTRCLILHLLGFRFGASGSNLTTMKYRAVCPGCGIRFSRKLYFRWLSHVQRRCPSCDCNYIANSLWEHIGNLLFAIPAAIPILLSIFHALSWAITITLVLAVYLIGFALFPYITKFVLVQKEQNHENPSV